MYTTKEIAEKAKVSMQTVSAWARRNNVAKMGRDYAFTDEQLETYLNKSSNLTVPGGAAFLAEELGVTREAITENARKLGYKKTLVDGRLAYVFTAQQEQELRGKICHK